MNHDEITYHGYAEEAGGCVVVLEDRAGQQVGVLAHIVKRSPDGMQWGYLGSGPADTARSILIAALGDRAACPSCAGTKKVVYLPDTYDEQPYDPARAADYDPESIAGCLSCDDGFRADLPYQRFKQEFVATWSGEWRMPRSDVLAWLARHGITA